jgi:YegS/Rv2252/BmrU family lipid kinase
VWNIIVNPIAGRGRTLKALPLLKNALQAKKIPYRLHFTEEPRHATLLARELAQNGAQVVGAMGGDGTAHEVLNGLIGSEATLAVIPSGTGNDLARGLNVPLEINAAVQALSGAPTRAIDYGVDTDAAFGVILGLGFTTQVMTQVNRYKDFLRGPLAITAAVLKVVHELTPDEMEIELDGKTICRKTVAVFIMNSCWTGGGMYVTPAAKLNDGLLHVCLVNELSRTALLALLPKVYSGGHVGHPAGEFFTCKTIKISAGRTMTKMFDGTVYGSTPVEARVIPGGIKVLAPSGGRLLNSAMN